MGARVVSELPRSIWDHYVRTHPLGNIYQTPEMFDVFQQTVGYQPILRAVIAEDDRVLALLAPVIITLAGGIARRATTRAIAYGSLLYTPDDQGRRALDYLLQSYQKEMKRQYLYTELRNSCDLADVQPILSEHGFEYEAHMNYLIDLTVSPNHLWKGVHANARRNIRKARKSGVVIDDIDSSARLAEACSVLEETYRRLQVPLADISLFQSALKILHPKRMLRIFAASVEDRTIGVLLLLLYKDTAHYWYTGMLREYSSYRPADLLAWHALEWSQQNGVCMFDFGGAGKPNQEYGVRDFKAKFGGDLVCYGRNVCVHAPGLLQISEWGYQIVRRFL